VTFVLYIFVGCLLVTVVSGLTSIYFGYKPVFLLWKKDRIKAAKLALFGLRRVKIVDSSLEAELAVIESLMRPQAMKKGLEAENFLSEARWAKGQPFR